MSLMNTRSRRTLVWKPAPLVAPRDRDLRLNYSFVLHDASDSRAVLETLSAARRHAAWLSTDRSAFGFPSTTLGAVDAPATTWLSARVGLWSYLPSALHDIAGEAPSICFVDGTTTRSACTSFFRAPALLNLPSDAAEQVAVAVLVARPGRHTSQLEMAGNFTWPGQETAALCALEACIQRHVAQWLPQRPLWAGPAEVVLPDEVSAQFNERGASRQH